MITTSDTEQMITSSVTEQMITMSVTKQKITTPATPSLPGNTNTQRLVVSSYTADYNVRSSPSLIQQTASETSKMSDLVGTAVTTRPTPVSPTATSDTISNTVTATPSIDMSFIQSSAAATVTTSAAIPTTSSVQGKKTLVPFSSIVRYVQTVQNQVRRRRYQVRVNCLII